MKESIKQLTGGFVLFVLLAFVAIGQAQTTNYVIATFDTDVSPCIANTNGVANGSQWINWYGTAYFTNVWDSSDASNNPNSGSMKVIADFPDAGIGGMYGSQFLVMDGYNDLGPGGAGLNGFQITNFSCDVRFDPTSNTNSDGTFGTLEFGTRGIAYTASDFGQMNIPTTQTNWVHVSFPVNAIADANITNIPSVFVKIYSGTWTGQTILYVDNVMLSGPMSVVSNPPPVMSVQKAIPGLRIFAGSSANTYDREQIVTLDQSQSWIGGTYPVTYSFTLLSAARVAGFQTHIFLLPVNLVGNAVSGNEYMDYQSTNSLWLQIVSQGNGMVTANVSWKTNLPNANPNNQALLITNSTAVGTWTLTFNNATSGTLTAPGASPASFTITNGTASTDFANPMIAVFGVQPNSTAGEGQYEDYAKVSVSGVVGFNENDDFTAESSLDSTIWDTSDSAMPASVILVATNNPYWISWNLPDVGFGLEISPDFNPADWHLPGYYNGFFGNQGTGNQFGLQKWVLVTPDILPSNSADNGNQSPSTNGTAFFRLANPPPND